MAHEVKDRILSGGGGSDFKVRNLGKTKAQTRPDEKGLGKEGAYRG